jgi:hypothetical protein
MWASTLLVLSSIACAASTPFHNHEHRDEHSVHRRLPGSWHQPRDHSVHELFKRAVGDFSEVGSAGNIWFLLLLLLCSLLVRLGKRLPR